MLRKSDTRWLKAKPILQSSGNASWAKVHCLQIPGLSHPISHLQGLENPMRINLSTSLKHFA
jgi:hypothetical protein